MALVQDDGLVGQVATTVANHDQTSSPVELESAHRKRQALHAISGEGSSDCRRNRSCESLQEQRGTIAFYKEAANHSI
jgi:hypothetical protein